ncbi:MAG: carboxypeptidase-like regulatory domain-containing protein [Planctomycetota bacterium]|nr:carboxypeptidase-like regulatory domain-containing protein [Planctomycetota bacterium]
MRSILRVLLLAALAWGTWHVLGADDGPGGPLSVAPDYADPSDPHTGDPRGVGTDASGSPRGVDSPSKTPARGESGGAAAVIEIHGRVVDSARQPVGEAAITLLVRGHVRAQAASAPDGSFVVRTPAGGGPTPERATLLARRDGYAAGTGDVWLAQALAITAEPIVLEPGHDLRVRVEIDGQPSPFATIAVVGRVGANVTPFATGAADPAGVTRFAGLAAGLYEVFATLPGRGRGMVHARLPQAEGEMAVVALGGERLLDVLVVDARSGQPLAGAEVLVGDQRTLPAPTGPGYLPALPPQRTNARGRATVRGLGLEETIYVNVEAPGYVPGVWWRSGQQIALPGVSEITVQLTRPRSVMLPIYAGAAGAPADGTPLAVELSARGPAPTGPEISARVDGAYVQIDGLSQEMAVGLLTAPDGRTARFLVRAGEDLGNAVEFLRARDVRVRIVRPGGAPVPDVALHLQPADGVGSARHGSTDASGVAVFEGLASAAMAVHLQRGDAPWGGLLLGRIDLAGEETEFEFELRDRVEVRLTVTLDGQPGLPARYVVLAAGQPVAPEEIVEQPGAGELELAMRPSTDGVPFEVILRAEGYLPAAFVCDPAAARPYALDLHAAGRVLVRVSAPPDGVYALVLERYLPDGERWVPTVSQVGPGAVPHDASDGVHAFDGLVPGRYRAIDTRTGRATDPLDVGAGARSAETALDLSASVDVHGRVFGPPGTDLAQALVLVEGRHRPSDPSTGIRVSREGRFVVRGIRGEALRLTVRHPMLRSGPTVRATGGGGVVELRLEPGPTATLRLAGDPPRGTGVTGSSTSSLEVRLLRGEEIVLAVRPTLADGAYVFGGYEPGTYTLWIGLAAGSAPWERKGVELGAGTTDLGTITPSAGATLVVRALGRAPGASFWVSATALEGPLYSRHAASGADGLQARVAGLGKGRFRIEVRTAGRDLVHEQVVEIRDEGETLVEFD